MDGLPITERYKELADGFPAIPDDKLLAHVWGCNLGAVTGARAKLRGMGYQIIKQTPNGLDGFSLWVVVERPKDRRVALMQSVAKLKQALAEKENQLATLLQEEGDHGFSDSS